MTLNESDIQTIASVMNELATEIDLHYEDNELASAVGAFEALRAGSEILSRGRIKLPDACHHILQRFQKAGVLA